MDLDIPYTITHSIFVSKRKKHLIFLRRLRESQTHLKRSKHSGDSSVGSCESRPPPLPCFEDTAGRWRFARPGSPRKELDSDVLRNTSKHVEAMQSYILYIYSL